MKPFEFHLPTRVIFGQGAIERLGDIATQLDFRRTLLVADRGMDSSGHVEEAMAPLRRAGRRSISLPGF